MPALSGTVIANYEQLSTVNGLGPRTRIVSVNKGTGNATEAELVAVIKALTVGTDVGSTNDAFTVAGIAGTIGTDPVYLAVQGTGTIGTSSGDYGTDITRNRSMEGTKLPNSSSNFRYEGKCIFF